MGGDTAADLDQIARVGAETLVSALADRTWKTIEPYFRPLLEGHLRRVESTRETVDRNSGNEAVREQEVASWATRLADAVRDNLALLPALRAAVAAGRADAVSAAASAPARTAPSGARATGRRSAKAVNTQFTGVQARDIRVDHSRRFHIALPFGFIFRSTKTVTTTAAAHPVAAAAVATVVAASAAGGVIATAGGASGGKPAGSTTHVTLQNGWHVVLDAKPLKVNTGLFDPGDIELLGGSLFAAAGSLAVWSGPATPTGSACLADVQDHGQAGASVIKAGQKYCATSVGGAVAFVAITAAVPQRVEMDVTVFP